MRVSQSGEARAGSAHDFNELRVGERVEAQHLRLSRRPQLRSAMHNVVHLREPARQRLGEGSAALTCLLFGSLQALHKTRAELG